MDAMQLIEAHTTYAPRCSTHTPTLEPDPSARAFTWRRQRQARFDESGLPRGLAVAR